VTRVSTRDPDTSPAPPEEHATKQRILDVTAELFRRYGYTGTGLKQIVAAANAPFGSVYHFFPGGKQQLGDAVVRRSGQMYMEIVEAVYASGPDPLTGVRDIFDGAAVVLGETDYVDACPIATVALEVASSNEMLRGATASVFESWIQRATTWMLDAGIDAQQARPVAIALIQLLEGGFMLSRAARTPEALRAAGDAAVALVRGALPARTARAARTARRPARR
jgi:AcrR family transcriptional regulator